MGLIRFVRLSKIQRKDDSSLTHNQNNTMYSLRNAIYQPNLFVQIFHLTVLYEYHLSLLYHCKHMSHSLLLRFYIMRLHVLICILLLFLLLSYQLNG